MEGDIGGGKMMDDRGGGVLKDEGGGRKVEGRWIFFGLPTTSASSSPHGNYKKSKKVKFCVAGHTHENVNGPKKWRNCAAQFTTSIRYPHNKFSGKTTFLLLPPISTR